MSGAAADIKLVCPMRKGEVCTGHPDFPRTCPPPKHYQGSTYCWLWVQEQRAIGRRLQEERSK